MKGVLDVNIIFAIIGGAFLWSFMEYALHHWVFHRLRIKTVGRREHLKHHSVSGYFSPRKLKVQLAVIGMVCVYSLAHFVFQYTHALWFTISFGVAYAYYEKVHYWHHARGPQTRYGACNTKHHFFHHFENARVNHGVTSPLWDWVFGTYRTGERIRVPKKFVMSWLVDEHGLVRERFKADYTIK